jgi:predicted permease
MLFGRIKPGVTHAQAAADLNTIAQQIAKEYPQYSRDIRIEFTPVTEMRTRRMRPMLRMLLVAVGLVLILACANVANLLLARGAERTHELSVRAALGASRRRILQQLLTEAMLLSLVSGVLAAILAHWTIKALVALNPIPIPYEIHPAVGGGVIAFIFALAIFTGLVFGSIPVLQLARPDVAGSLTANPRTASGSKKAARLRSAFVACQLAICFVLLIGSGLLAKTWMALRSTDTGFDSKNLLTLEYRVPRVKYKTREEQWAFHRTAIEKIRQIPGVESAALVQAIPFSGNYGEMQFTLPGQPVETGKEPVARTNMVTPGYFNTVRLPLLQGRDFTDSDDANAPVVAIIDRTMQQTYFRNVDPVGREMLLFTRDQLPDGKPAPPKRATIIGVAADAKYVEVREEHRPQVYIAYAQNSGLFASLVLRATGDPMSLQEPVRQAVWSVDKDQPMWKIRTMDFLIQRALSQEKALLYLMCAFGALAVLLSAAGTYAVISHSVTRRTQEFGVRLALGASRGGIVQLVLANGIKVALIGLAIGVVTAIATSRLLRSILFNVSTTDASTYAAALIFIGVVVVIACALPAMRASRIDPSTALRYE